MCADTMICKYRCCGWRDYHDFITQCCTT